MLKILFALVGILPAVAWADFYLYPNRVDLDISCSISSTEIKAIEAQYSHPNFASDGIAKATAVDLNRDQQCEIFVDTPAMDEGNGNAFTMLLIKRHNEFVLSGEIQWNPDAWWYGEFHKGYPRIFVPTYTGHRTNPEYVTAVYAFDGSQYVVESGTKATHGYYLDHGLQAYRAGDFILAEKFYLNAYRMHKEPLLSDASNLSLAWMKLGKLAEAKALLERHLDAQSPTPMRASGLFNLALVEEKLGNFERALQLAEDSHYLVPTAAAKRKVSELRARIDSTAIGR